MSNRAAFMTQADANRMFKAAKTAGYERARVISYPDGRMEVVVETVRPDAAPAHGVNEWDEVLP